MSNTPAEKILALASAITNLITSHYNITGSSQQKGHTQAGGAPQSIGDSLSAGTDNGYYARADHVHTATTSHVKDTNAYSNLNISANSTQQQINYAINQRIINTVDEKPTYMSIDDDLNFYVGYDPIINTTLTANKAVIQSGQTSTLSATVKTTNNALLEGAPVEFYNGNILLGNGVSNSSGIASYTYTGSGAGKQTITAKAGSVVSQPYPVIDAIMVDSGTSVKDWSYKNNLEQSSDGTETTLTQTSTGSSAVKRIDNLTPDLCFEMDIKVSSLTAFTGTLFSFREGSTSGRANVNISVLGDTNYHHLKMWTDSSKVYIQVDNGTTSSISLSGAYNRFYLQFEGGISVTYKNFCYYPI